jgi:hypothetical protein
MEKYTLTADFCVVGGGLAGMAAAVSAARHGVKTIIIQDRPMFGGNSSSEIRMHVCGAHGENRRETGFVEELLLDNFYYNYSESYSVWDAVLHGKMNFQENLTVLMNASVNSAECENNLVKSVTAWQLTTEHWITVEAKLFADCSGDGILAPLTGADFRMGREARHEFNESIAPLEADTKTMGLSCLFQAREYATPQPFTPMPWAYKYTKDNMFPRYCDVRRTNMWWMEVGGMGDSIGDTEKCRHELLRIAFGVWDFIKNESVYKDELKNYALDWQCFIPGKRESRRYYGEHILTQNDVEAEGRFDDIVAYGGWSMDDHFPEGIYHKGDVGTIFHPAPSPFGIPYRTLYSRNIDNLFCAGRCHSATHSAMSATRVMATCSMMGQAVGTAASIAVREGITPSGVYKNFIAELQKTLMDDDVWIPWKLREMSKPVQEAELIASAGEGAENVRNGFDRDWEGNSNAWEAPIGSSIEYRFKTAVDVEKVRIIFDSNLNRIDPSRPRERPKNMRYFKALDDVPFTPPNTLVKAFTIEVMDAAGGWHIAAEENNNFQRHVRVPVNKQAYGIRLTPKATWGAENARVFSLDLI